MKRVKGKGILPVRVFHVKLSLHQGTILRLNCGYGWKRRHNPFWHCLWVNATAPKKHGPASFQKIM